MAHCEHHVLFTHVSHLAARVTMLLARYGTEPMVCEAIMQFVHTVELPEQTERRARLDRVGQSYMYQVGCTIVSSSKL